jgi:hypothetical protein
MSVLVSSTQKPSIASESSNGCNRKRDSGPNLGGLIPGSAGVPPAGIGNSHGVDSKGKAGETPALPGAFLISFESHFQLHPRLILDLEAAQKSV